MLLLRVRVWARVQLWVRVWLRLVPVLVLALVLAAISLVQPMVGLWPTAAVLLSVLDQFKIECCLPSAAKALKLAALTAGLKRPAPP
jgi:hypothetical protein